jgi:hypothetical protein
VVADVAQVSLQFLVHAVLGEATGQPVQHAGQRGRRPLELDDLARQLVDPPGHPGVAAEDLDLDLVDVVLQAGDHRAVPVHDLVEDRVEHRLRTADQDLRAGLHPPPDRGQVRRLAVPDGDDEVRAGEDVQLAERDLLRRVDVAGRPQHAEERVAVALQLRPLVRGDRVLHGQLVQLELGGDRGEVHRVRPVEPDPGHPIGGGVQRLVRLRERRRGGDAVPVDVDGAVHHPAAAAAGLVVLPDPVAVAAHPRVPPPPGEAGGARERQALADHAPSIRVDRGQGPRSATRVRSTPAAPAWAGRPGT